MSLPFLYKDIKGENLAKGLLAKAIDGKQVYIPMDCFHFRKICPNPITKLDYRNLPGLLVKAINGYPVYLTPFYTEYYLIPGDFMTIGAWNYYANAHWCISIDNFDESLGEFVQYYGPVACKGGPLGLNQFSTDNIWMWGTYTIDFASVLLYPDRNATGHTENGWAEYQLTDATEWGMDTGNVHQVGVCILWDGVYYDPENPTAWKDHILMDWYNIGFPGNEDPGVWQYHPFTNSTRGPGGTYQTLDRDPNSGEVYFNARITLRQIAHTSYTRQYCVIMKRNGLRDWSTYLQFECGVWEEYGQPDVNKPWDYFNNSGNTMCVWRGLPVFMIKTGPTITPAKWHLFFGTSSVHTWNNADYPDYPVKMLKTEDGILMWNEQSRKIWWFDGNDVYEYDSPTGTENLNNPHSYFVNDPYTAGSPIYFKKALDYYIDGGKYYYPTELYRWNTSAEDPEDYTWDLFRNPTQMQFAYEWAGKYSQTRDKQFVATQFNPYGWDVAGWFVQYGLSAPQNFQLIRTGRNNTAWNANDNKYSSYMFGMVSFNEDFSAATRVLQLQKISPQSEGYVPYEYPNASGDQAITFKFFDTYIKGAVKGVNCDHNSDVFIRISTVDSINYDVDMYANEDDWEAATNRIAYASYSAVSTRYTMTEDNDSGIDARFYARQLITLDKFVCSLSYVDGEWVIYPRAQVSLYGGVSPFVMRVAFTNGLLENPIDFQVANTTYNRPEFE